MLQTTPSAPLLDITAIRAEFPILQRIVHGSKPLVYLDNAATTQKPTVVIDTIAEFYRQHNANAHRAGHVLGAEVTSMYERAREVVAESIGARADEVVFTRGTTESLNLLATSIGAHLGSRLANGNIVLTEMEHHANIVPWQMLRDRSGVEIRVIPLTDDGALDMGRASHLIDASTLVVSCVHVSNTLGTENDVRTLCESARTVGAISIVDSAQSVSSMSIDVQNIGCDALVFSGHKVYGPMGIGCAFIRHDLLSVLPPYQGGGSMITNVTFDKTTYADGPMRFEAGTPNIEGAVGLCAAMQWRNALDLHDVQAHKASLTEELVTGLSSRAGVRVHGAHQGHSGIVSFSIDGVHPQDVGIMLDTHGIAVRTGHHCTMPLMQRFAPQGTVRVSAAVYSSHEEIAQFFHALDRVMKVLH
ncbi:MAG: aminotransferase class V-fold PLP-dependent enzyme [Candidatus Kapaibacterium sp.]